MKNLSDTPRTDEVRHNTAELAMHARKLERELAELKAIHKTAITDCQQYTPARWKEICNLQEPAAVWIDGKQMTELMKNQTYIRGAACHEEGGEIFVTDQSGNGKHAKLKQ
jgi:hypothetical protein